MPARRRLFVAVWPPAELLEKLAGLVRPDVPFLRWTTRDQWHVTLRFLGSVAEDEVEPLVRSLDRLAALPASAVARPVVAVAGPEPKRLGNGVWMLPVTGLEMLAAAVDGLLDARSGAPDAPDAADATNAPDAPDAPDATGPVPPERPFTGHLTLARAKRPSALRGLPATAVKSTWNVDEVTLVSSTLHPHGARYEVIERWRI